jgi:hypothetical protein
MSSISTDELRQIKEILEQKMNESSDSEYSPSESSGDSDYSSVKKKKIKIDYKTKYNQSESKYRYLQLEMSNLNIEISELKESLIVLTKHNLLFKNINFLFERVDNAIKILNERVDTKDESILKFNTLHNLQNIVNLCNKTKDKYESYINSDVYPLFLDDQSVLKTSITNYYLDKIKGFDSIITKINNLEYKIKTYNFILVGSTISCFLISGISLSMIICYYYFM